MENQGLSMLLNVHIHFNNLKKIKLVSNYNMILKKFNQYKLNNQLQLIIIIKILIIINIKLFKTNQLNHTNHLRITSIFQLKAII